MRYSDALRQLEGCQDELFETHYLVAFGGRIHNSEFQEMYRAINGFCAHVWWPRNTDARWVNDQLAGNNLAVFAMEGRDLNADNWEVLTAHEIAAEVQARFREYDKQHPPITGGTEHYDFG